MVNKISIPDIGKEITIKEFKMNTVEIRNRMGEIVNNFFFIGEQLKIVKDNKLFKLGDYKTFVQYCKEEFGIGKNQAYNFIGVYENFNYDDYKDFSYSTLVEMLSLPRDERKEIKKDTTVKEIREKKRSKKEIIPPEIEVITSSEKIEGQLSIDDVIDPFPLDRYQLKLLTNIIDYTILNHCSDIESKLNKNSSNNKKNYGKEKIDLFEELGTIVGILKDKMETLPLPKQPSS